MKLIVFDFDGTIADSFPHVIKILNKIGPIYGLPRVEKHEIEQLRDLGIKDLIKKFNISKLKLTLFVVHLKTEMKLGLKHITLFPGVIEIIKELRENGYPVEILSTNSVRSIKKILGDNNTKLFRNITSKLSLTNKTKGLNSLIKKYSLKPDQLIYIGDEVRDLDGCKESGAKFIGVGWGFNSKKVLERNGALVADSIEELFSLIHKSL